MKTVYNSYDAYGVASTLYYNGGSNTRAFYNPFRYRSYYYDHGIGLYFLKTRYYDPEIGRFMTIDDISYLDPESINGLNLYAYCGNNPVMNIDPFGTETFSISVGYFLGIFGGGYSGSFGISAYTRNLLGGVKNKNLSAYCSFDSWANTCLVELFCDGFSFVSNNLRI